MILSRFQYGLVSEYFNATALIYYPFRKYSNTVSRLTVRFSKLYFGALRVKFA